MQLPERIADYRVEGVLGRGADGIVLRVRDTRLDRPAALKLLNTAADAEARARFMIEARAAGRIIHPNIVQVFSIGEHDGHAFIVAELVDGCPVSELLEVRGRLSPRSVIEIGIQAARGLSRAARAGVVHRDVKPHNLLVTEDGQVKITDFGLAKLLESPSALTETGTTLGTPHYMSPEQGQARALDARSDQYSLGATLYHLLAGRPPFDAETPLAILLKHLEEQVAPLAAAAPECPEELAAVVEKMLAKRPDDRFPDFDAAIAALESATAAIDAADRAELAAEVAMLPERDTAEHNIVRTIADQPAAAFEDDALAVSASQLAAAEWTKVAERLFALGAVAAAVAIVLVALDRQPEPTPDTRVAAAAPRFRVPEPQVLPAAPPRPFGPQAPAVAAQPSLQKATRAELVAALESGGPSGADAARILGEGRDQSATPSLIQALGSADPRIASAAATALGELLDVRAIEPLESLAQHSTSRRVQDAARRALQRLWRVEP
jgi:serine/threonine-protein kinase